MKKRLLIDPDHYQGRSTDRVITQMLLGAMGRRLQELAAIPVEHRPLDLYAALVEGNGCQRTKLIDPPADKIIDPPGSVQI